MPSFPKTIEMTSFMGGLNNVLPPERTSNEFLKVAENIDIDKSGGIHKRLGYKLKMGGNIHSLWSDENQMVMVKDNDLVRVAPGTYHETLLKSGVGPHPISFTNIQESTDVFFTSEALTGRISHDNVEEVGYVAPTPINLLETLSGAPMAMGRYQVTTTYVDSNGKESGSRVAAQIDIQSGSIINVSGMVPSTDPAITHTNIYCSMPNGNILYLVRTVLNNTTDTTIASVHSEGVTPLKSFNMSPAPHGEIIGYYRGRIYIVQDNILWYSSPHSFDWFNLQSDFFQFERTITEVMPVENGIWIGTDQGLFYLGGKTPEEMKLNMVESIQVVRGTSTRIMGGYLFIENTPIGYKWLVTTEKGVFVCFNNGIALSLTEINVVFPKAGKGVSTFIQEDGINRYLTLLEGGPKKTPMNNVGASDIVTATIIRNGITI